MAEARGAHALRSRLGFGSALAAGLASLAAVVALLAVGGSPWTGLADYAASYRDVALAPYVLWMALGIFVLVAFACLHDERRNLLSRLALAFCLPYVTIISVNYTLQFTLVRHAILGGEFAGIEPWVASNPGSVVLLTDVLGYFFLGLTTLFAAPLFAGDRLRAAIRWLMVVHAALGVGGLVAIAVVPFGSEGAQFSAAAALAIWGVLFGVLMLLLALHFRDRARTPPADAPSPGPP